tara:strand:- start:880 stop:1077 length:198 start_codon:yes stop_codon:yes gene_type:complete
MFEHVIQALKSKTIRLQIFGAVCLVIYQLVPGLELSPLVEVGFMSLFITANIIVRYMTTGPMSAK